MELAINADIKDLNNKINELQDKLDQTLRNPTLVNGEVAVIKIPNNEDNKTGEIIIDLTDTENVIIKLYMHDYPEKLLRYKRGI